MTRAQFVAARTNLVAARRAQLVAILTEGPATVTELAELLGVGKSCVERDLAELIEVLPIQADPDPRHRQRQVWRLEQAEVTA
jgi:predicted transcriptional regulator